MKRITTLLTALVLSTFASVASAATTLPCIITDVGTAAPTPGPNDISIFYPSYQLDDGLNYYWDNGTPPGQTFTAGGNAGGYTLTNLTIKTHGGGGNGELNTGTYILRIYSLTPDGTTASLITTYSISGKLNAENDWLQFNGLSVQLTNNGIYGYTLHGGNGYEELANDDANPYAGGEICTIPTGGGGVVYGATHVSDALFDAGLALGSVAGGTPAMADTGATAPTPGANDISQLLPANTPSQNDYGLNYYWDNGTPPGQTFTTVSNSIPWIMTNLLVKTAGGGGGGDLNSQLFTLRIYSVSNKTATLVQTYTNTGRLNSENGEWFQFSGISFVMATNKQYAYTLSRGGSGYEHLADYSGSHYPGGQICTIPPAGGTLNYGNGGTNYSDAGFDVGLLIPTVWANSPTYTPTSADGNVYAGTQITLNEAGVGIGTLFYQWQTDGGGGSLTNVPGATNATLAVDTTSFTPGSSYNYAAIVSITNNGGSAMTSAPVTLTIVAASAPFIVTDTTASPNTATSFVGLSETFTTSIEGTLPIAYQWQVSPNPDGSGAVNVSGGTNATLMLSNLQLTDSGYYSLQATNTISPFTLNSTWTQLTVVPLTNQFVHWQPPVTFNGLTAGQILTNSTPGNFLEGAYFGNAGTNIPVTVNGVTYTFYGDGTKASISGNAGVTHGSWLLGGTNTTSNANFDTVLDQFAFDGGTATHTITLHNLLVGSNYCVQVFAFDDRGAGSGRTTDFQDPANAADVSATYGMPDNDYLVGTFTANGTDVAIQQNLLNGAGNVGVVIVGTVGFAPAYPPKFLVQPSSVGAFPGRTAQFSAPSDGIPAPTYLWQVSTDGGTTFANLADGVFGDVTISGSTTTNLAVANLQLDDSGWLFMNTATNLVGGISSAPVTLTVNAAPFLSGANSTNVLALHPVAYWPLNETSDPSTGGVGVYDASGNQHDGAYLAAALNGFDGIVGPQAADGYPQFATGQGATRPQAGVPNSWANTPALNLNTNTVTITMWINPVGAQADATGLFVNRNAGTVAGMTYSTGQALGYVWNNNEAATYGYIAGPVIPSDVWSFVALVITPTNASFYVINTNNGVASTTFAHSHANMSWGGTSGNIYLGADSQLARVFNGVLDEPAVFNFALTSSQLQALAGIATPVNTNAATLNFTAAVTGGAGSQTLNFSWAADHQGWDYTNAAGLRATGSWFPVPGSANVTSERIGINPAKTNVFFQMRYP